MLISQLNYRQIFTFKGKNIKYQVYTIEWFNNSNRPRAIHYTILNQTKIFSWYYNDFDSQIILRNS